MEVRIIENSILNTGFKAGHKVTHADLGIGIIVGFSERTGNPSVFFYAVQKEFEDRAVSVGIDTISFPKEAL